MGEVSGGTGGMTSSQIQGMIDAALPQPSAITPPPVALNSAVGVQGASSGFARADHTHQSSIQSRRVQLTFDANGEAIYTYVLPYASGVIPVVQATAENLTSNSYRYDATVKQGSANNTQVTIVLTKTPKTLTVSVLGAVLNIFTTTTDTAWVNITSRAPSA